MYKFKLPIGDWFNDGHGKCDFYIVECNKSVEEVRDIHFQIESMLGINIHKICSEYEDNTIRDEAYEKLKSLGFKDWDDYPEESYGWVSSDIMAELWMFLLRTVDPNLNIYIVDDKIPMLPFYGYKDGRHIGFVGYGCFW